MYSAFQNMYQPGVMVGEDIGPNGKPLNKTKKPTTGQSPVLRSLYPPGVMVGEDVKPPTNGQSPVLRSLYPPGVMVGEDVAPEAPKKPVVKDIDTSVSPGVTVTRRPTTFELSQLSLIHISEPTRPY